MGQSQFDLKAWIPKYLRWYRFAFGPPLSVADVRRQAAAIAQKNQRESQA